MHKADGTKVRVIKERKRKEADKMTDNREE
jgi:hypothetical protein